MLHHSTCQESKEDYTDVISALSRWDYTIKVVLYCTALADLTNSRHFLARGPLAQQGSLCHFIHGRESVHAIHAHISMWLLPIVRGVSPFESSSGPVLKKCDALPRCYWNIVLESMECDDCGWYIEAAWVTRHDMSDGGSGGYCDIGRLKTEVLSSTTVRSRIKAGAEEYRYNAQMELTFRMRWTCHKSRKG